MLEEFIEFVNSVLPSVDQEAKDKAKAAITQFSKDNNSIEWFSTSVLPYLSQGDVISNIKFSYFKDNGEQYEFKAMGFILSTSCHIDQKEYLNIAPILPIESFKGDANAKKELMKNRVFDYMYLPDSIMKDYYVDFSKINTYRKKLIMGGINEGKIKRIFSLSQIGFYFFIVKLTVFFMRKEDIETMENRSI